MGCPAVGSSPSFPSNVPDEYRHMDNFEDEEVILRRTDEVSKFMSEMSGSASSPRLTRNLLC